MKYTWGYIKETVLAKLDIDQTEALDRGLINKMPYYANEVMTQICSTVKPKHKRVKFIPKDNLSAWNEALKYAREHNLFLPKEYETAIIDKPVILTHAEKEFWACFDEQICIGKVIAMPDDFLAFDDNAPMYKGDDTCGQREATDEDFSYEGDDALIFHKVGEFEIYYKAIWYFFTSKTADDAILDIPYDVINCIPSYIVSQLFKIDDEVKAQIYRNEFETLLARIDDTYFKRPETIKIGGGW